MADSSYRVKVKALDRSVFELLVTSDMTVRLFKELINLKTSVPSDSQRLIFKGCLLHSDFTLGHYNIYASNTILLVAYTRADPIQNLLSSQPPAQNRPLSVGEQSEALNQTLQTIETISSVDRKFRVHQWVDVKDTVDQWLEAQIMDIQFIATGQLLYIHYFGWPERWDEWIHSSSPRVQVFRSKTVQTGAGQLQSPYPKTPLVVHDPKASMEEVILRSFEVMTTACSFLQGGEGPNVGGVLDRAGRLMSDLGASISKRCVMPSTAELARSGRQVNVHIHALVPSRDFV